VVVGEDDITRIDTEVVAEDGVELGEVGTAAAAAAAMREMALLLTRRTIMAAMSQRLFRRHRMRHPKTRHVLVRRLK
jgi:hypothetical protein